MARGALRGRTLRAAIDAVRSHSSEEKHEHPGACVEKKEAKHKRATLS